MTQYTPPGQNSNTRVLQMTGTIEWPELLAGTPWTYSVVEHHPWTYSTAKHYPLDM